MVLFCKGSFKEIQKAVNAVADAYAAAPVNSNLVVTIFSTTKSKCNPPRYALVAQRKIRSTSRYSGGGKGVGGYGRSGSLTALKEDVLRRPVEGEVPTTPAKLRGDRSPALEPQAPRREDERSSFPARWLDTNDTDQAELWRLFAGCFGQASQGSTRKVGCST